MRKRNQTKRAKAFTIVELLTVMSIIIILIGLLVPALNQIKRYAKEVVQRKQLKSIDEALIMYESEIGDYPDSGEQDGDGDPYCGAMKLAEAVLGQDLLGYHPDSKFDDQFEDNSSTPEVLYQIPGATPAITQENIDSRYGPYLPRDTANPSFMGTFTAVGQEYIGLYGQSPYSETPFREYHRVICDVYTRNIPGAGVKLGMPVLYYRAQQFGNCNPNEENGIAYDAPTTGADKRIYLYEDNQEIVNLGVPWQPDDNLEHPMDADTPQDVLENFYWRIDNPDVPLEKGRPYRDDSYILISAGFDGLYGTRDDIYNFKD